MWMLNADRAVVEIEKPRDYCLSFAHPRGRHKARVFQSALGLTADHVELLREALLAAAQTDDDAPAADQDEYGQRYTVDFFMPALLAAPRFGAVGSSASMKTSLA